MWAEAGQGLTCRAHNHTFEVDGAQVERGIVSHYATQALPGATTVGVWLQGIETLVEADVRRGVLPGFRIPALQVIGDPGTSLPGTRVAGAGPGTA